MLACGQPGQHPTWPPRFVCSSMPSPFVLRVSPQPFAGSPPAAANPGAVSPRILLFQAAVAANQNELALSALMPLVDQSIMASPPPESPENEAASKKPKPLSRSYLATVFLAGQELGASQKSVIAAQMAGAFQKLDRPRGSGATLESGIVFSPRKIPFVPRQSSELEQYARPK